VTSRPRLRTLPWWPWRETVARTFAKRFCEAMAADSPTLYTVSLTKAQRRGRLFLDYLRNDPGHHAVAAYSPRARPGAPVSVPLSWQEATPRLDPQAYTIASVDSWRRRRARGAAITPRRDRWSEDVTMKRNSTRHDRPTGLPQQMPDQGPRPLDPPPPDAAARPDMPSAADREQARKHWRNDSGRGPKGKG
jgi:hypothetical protein